MKDQDEMNVLDELNKGACMGMDAIHFILDKVQDHALKEELNRQYRDYQAICLEIKKIYPEFSTEDKEPHKTNKMTKAMTWYGIELRTMFDDRPSKMAELLLQGTNMGIIEGRRLLNHHQTKGKVHDLLRQYVDMQEKAVEKLKNFYKKKSSTIRGQTNSFVFFLEKYLRN